jgi:hypothetical protein
MQEGVKEQRHFAARPTGKVRLHAKPMAVIATLGPRAQLIIAPLFKPVLG